MKTFGDRLLASLAAHGMTQAQFSRRSGISEPDVSHYISGQRKPGVDTLSVMLRVLRQENARWLITGESH